MIAKTNTQHYQNIADEIRTANDYATFKSEIEVDNELFEDIGEAIAEKDGGEVAERSGLVERIGAIKTIPEFDMTVTDNQVKMVIEVNDYDLSFWTRFGISGGTVTVDWGDGTSDEYTGNATLKYAPQRKHNYQEAGRYLVTETVENGILTIGSINNYSTLSEGKIDNYYNAADTLRYMYNYKIKELAYGDNIVINIGLDNIPYVKIYNDIGYIYVRNTATDSITVKDGVNNIAEYKFQGATAYVVKIPNSVTTISSNAFSGSKIRIIDFTSIRLNENNELPITFKSTNIFNSTSPSMILLFATQEIAEVAKTTTNLSQLASRIKYVGEVES